MLGTTNPILNNSLQRSQGRSVHFHFHIITFILLTKFHPVWSTIVPGSPKNPILSVVPESTVQLVSNSRKKTIIYRY
jgi:hypothetical protein